MVVKVRDPYRKRPVQARSEATVAAILEATARILNGSKGASTLNTNAIAATAGISIGTLYQYFPDKNAILIARRGRNWKRLRESWWPLSTKGRTLTLRIFLAGWFRPF